MGLFRERLPQLEGLVCLTDGGLETDLCFNKGVVLPEFAAYGLLRDAAGRQLLLDYFSTYVDIAARYGLGLVLDTPTWRANRDWGARLGDSPAALQRLNLLAVDLLVELRAGSSSDVPIVISGCLGPRGDGYRPDAQMSAQAATDYHSEQMAVFAASEVDMVAAMTLNYVGEAVGIARAAQQHDLAACIALTVETDGRLPDGNSLRDAIAAVDDASGGAPAYYMINCAHPSHFGHLFADGGEWLQRIKGLRGNASRMSHAELDNAAVLDDGDPQAFGRELRALRDASPQLTVLGGCCGTDHRHLDQVGCNLSSERQSSRLAQ